MYPRFLVTVDENLAVQKVSVRVGQAVDTVAAAGRYFFYENFCLMIYFATWLRYDLFCVDSLS